MNLIIRDGSIDRFATNEEFIELESTINEDLRRTLILLDSCSGEKEDLINTIEKIRRNLSTRNTASEDLEIALVDNYVVFNLVDDNRNPLGFTEDNIPDIVIMKRNMRSIYLLKKIESANIYTERKEYLSKIQVTYEATHYNYTNENITKSQTKFDTFIEEDLEEPFMNTDQFMNTLNKALSKIIIFNNNENK